MSTSISSNCRTNLRTFVLFNFISFFLSGQQLIPQSPRYLVLRGRPDEALKIINRIAKFNCRQIIQEQLVIKREDKKVIPSFVKVNFVKHQSSQLTPSEESEKVMLLPGGKNDPRGNDLHKKVRTYIILVTNVKI